VTPAVLLLLFVAGEPQGAIGMPDLATCETVAARANADPAKPANAIAICYVKPVRA
jgi:hypothetical protein